MFLDYTTTFVKQENISHAFERARVQAAKGGDKREGEGEEQQRAGVSAGPGVLPRN